MSDDVYAGCAVQRAKDRARSRDPRSEEGDRQLQGRVDEDTVGLYHPDMSL